MKKQQGFSEMEQNVEDTMQAEYDFSAGVRGKYAKALQEEGYIVRIRQDDGTLVEKEAPGEKMVILESDVLEYFPDSQAVNHALRTLIALVAHKPQ